MWVTWHGMGAWRGRQRAEACPVRGGFWLWVCELGGEQKACDSPGWRLVLDTTIWHSLRPGEPGAARNRKHGVRGQTSSNIPENERVLEGQDAVRAEGGDECYLKRPASARRGTQPLLHAASMARGQVQGPCLAARLGLSWVCSGLVCLCACVRGRGRASGWTAKRWRSPLNLDPAHQ